MTYSQDDKINAFLRELQEVSDLQFELVSAIRQLFLQANTALLEGIKYGGLTFSLTDGLVGGIYVYQQHISIEFSHGVTFKDPDCLLQGNGKYRRHLKIMTPTDINNKQAIYYIQQAVQ